MSKHTPGPWAKHNPSNPTQTALIVRELPNHKRTVVAVIPDHLQFGNASVTDWLEMESNARLVAAAPELLDALRAMLENWEYGGLQPYPIAQARAAIIKAVGSGN
jgi:hypothetical protein